VFGGIVGAAACSVFVGVSWSFSDVSLSSINLFALLSKGSFLLFLFSGFAGLACLIYGFTGNKKVEAVELPVVASANSLSSSVGAVSGLGGCSSLGFIVLQAGTRIVSVSSGSIELPEGGFLYPPKLVQPQSNVEIDVIQEAPIPVRERQYFKPKLEVSKH
jgi:hypothetical protein